MPSPSWLLYLDPLDPLNPLCQASMHHVRHWIETRCTWHLSCWGLHERPDASASRWMKSIKYLNQKNRNVKYVFSNDILPNVIILLKNIDVKHWTHLKPLTSPNIHHQPFQKFISYSPAFQSITSSPSTWYFLKHLRTDSKLADWAGWHGWHGDPSAMPPFGGGMGSTLSQADGTMFHKNWPPKIIPYDLWYQKKSHTSHNWNVVLNCFCSLFCCHLFYVPCSARWTASPKRPGEARKPLCRMQQGP